MNTHILEYSVKSPSLVCPTAMFDYLSQATVRVGRLSPQCFKSLKESLKDFRSLKSLEG